VQGLIVLWVALPCLCVAIVWCFAQRANQGMSFIKECLVLDELNTPLKLKSVQRKMQFDIPYGWIAVCLCGGLFLSLVVFLMVTDDHQGGEPFAVASIERAAPTVADMRGTNIPALSVDDVTGSITPAPGVAVAKTQSADDIEKNSGVKVLRGNNDKAPSALVIEIPDNTGVQLVPAPDKRLAEAGKYGILPKTGPDGLKAMNVYARPLPVAARPKAGMPVVALVFGGVGLAEPATQAAIAKLPEEVTLGFAPYGRALEAHVREARDAGHEIVLQVPMESFEYPANNPGPETLLASADEATNLTHLRMLMGKMSGYIGLMNYQGGRFTAEPAALAPIVREVAARGLMMVDDGSSPRSRIGAVAAGLAVPVVQGNIIIDGLPQKDAINQQLTKLEALARSRGMAVGIANGYPVTIDLIADWARGLQARGLALVPLSAVTGTGAKTQLEQNP